MFVTRGSKNSLILSLILFPTWIVVKDINFGSTKVIQWVPRQHKVLNHRQERFFLKVNSVSIHSFVEWLDTFSYVLRPADVTIKEVNHIRCFAIDIAKDLMLLSCRHTMERLCALQRLSPHCLHWPTVDEGLDIAALTSVSLMLIDRRNATTGG